MNKRTKVKTKQYWSGFQITPHSAKKIKVISTDQLKPTVIVSLVPHINSFYFLKILPFCEFLTWPSYS